MIDAAVEEAPKKKKKKKKSSKKETSSKLSSSDENEKNVASVSSADFSTAILGSADKNAMTVYPFDNDDGDDDEGDSVRVPVS